MNNKAKTLNLSRLNMTTKRLCSGLFFFAALLASVCASAELVSLDNSKLDKVTGQNGVLIDAELQFNRSQNTDGTIADKINCTKGGTDCELAIKLDGDDGWLTLYDVSGGLDIKNVKVSASSVTPASGVERSAIEIGDTSGNYDTTIAFNDFGASSLAFTQNQGTIEGYRAPVPLGDTGTLDDGAPKGILGVKLNGNLTMTGGLKLFNCTGLNIAGC